MDELGGLDKALEVVKRKANIAVGEQVSVVLYPTRRSILDILVRRSQDDNMLETKLGQIFGRVPFRAWMNGGYLRIAPNWMVVK